MLRTIMPGPCGMYEKHCTCLHLNFLWAGGKLLPCESADPGDKLGVVELKGLVDHEVGISAEAELDTVDVTV